MTEQHRSSYPAQFRIKLKECLDANWSDGFEEMAMSFDGGVTILSGRVSDQAALHGLLNRIRDLNLNLLLVERLDPGQQEEQ